MRPETYSPSAAKRRADGAAENQIPAISFSPVWGTNSVQNTEAHELKNIRCWRHWNTRTHVVATACGGESNANWPCTESYRAPAFTADRPFVTCDHLSLAIGLPLRNQEALTNLLRQLYDPTNPLFRHYLTPQQFAEMFGPTKEDYEALAAYAKKGGFEVTDTHPNRTLLDVRASVADVERFFHVQMNRYQHPTENRAFFAPDAEPSLDQTLPVLVIAGLNDFVRPHALSHKIKPRNHGMSGAPMATGSGPGGAFVSRDFRAAYVPGVTLTGAGQTVGLLAFDAGFCQSNLASYEALAGLPNVPVTAVLLDGYSGAAGSGNGEISLDIDMAMAIAPGLSQILVYEGSAADDLLNRIATDNIAKQISSSWGFSVDAETEQIFQQFAVQGQSFFIPSGDGDAWVGVIGQPGDDPYITVVGGTELTTTGPGGAWASEAVWNWGYDPPGWNGTGTWGSGGGVTTTHTIPSWQVGISMSANHGSTTMRNIPDVAIAADDVYTISATSAGGAAGTSCAAPLWAGFTALADEQALAGGRPTVGFINPAIYAIGQGPSYNSCFHDITTGNNTNTLSPSLYYAVPGYELCTGWGTPTAGLINALALPDYLQIFPTVGFNASGGVGGPFAVASQAFTFTNTGADTLSWTVAPPAPWLTASSTGGTLAPGATTLVTVSLNSVANNLTLETYTATVWFTNLNDSVAFRRLFTLSILSPPVITTQPSKQAVAYGATAVFSVAASGGQPLSYQWWANGVDLTDSRIVFGSATSTLTVSNVSPSSVGTYFVTVSNAALVATSEVSSLSITDYAPILFQQSTNHTMPLGAAVWFTVEAYGAPPFFYQWTFDGTNLIDHTQVSGSQSNMLILTNVSMGDMGTYQVVVTNAYGSITSAAALLTIPGPCVPPPPGLITWWPADGNAVDIVRGNNGTLVGGVTFTNGEVGYAFDFDGTNQYISLSGSYSLGGSRTIEAWIFPRPHEGLGGPIMTFGSSGQADFWGVAGPASGMLANELYVDHWGKAEFRSFRSVPSNEWSHVALTSDGAEVIFYLSGQSSRPVSGALYSYDLNTCTIGGNTIGGSTTGQSFDGLIDGIAVFNRALSSNEVAAIYAAGSAGMCMGELPPTIVAQPSSQTVAPGNTVSFSVSAHGTAPLNYQWLFNGANLTDNFHITGSQGSMLTLTSVSMSNMGTYQVVVTNAYGSVTSALAVLAPELCVPPPLGLVSWWPASGNAVDIVSGSNGTLVGGVTFTNGEVGFAFDFDGANQYVSASGSYYFRGSRTIEAWICPRPHEGLGGPIMTFGSSGEGDVWGIAGPAFGILPNELYVDHWGTPMFRSFLSVPSNEWSHVALTFDGAGVTFYLNGESSMPVSGALYSYDVNTCTIGGNTIGGSTTSRSFDGLMDGIAVFSRVLSSNEVAAIYAAGSAGMCMRELPPTIVAQPSSQIVGPGNAVGFSVSAHGTAPLNYQWLFNGADLADNFQITGSQSNMLTITSATMSNAGTYEVVVSNAYGSTSVAATLTLIPPPVIQTVKQSGSSFTFTWSTLTNQAYQIQGTANLAPANWTNLAGPITASNSSMAISEPIGANAQHFYRVVLLP